MYPKEAWKFKAWTAAMLQGATVGKPEYKAKGLGTSKNSQPRKRRRRRRRKKNAKKD